MKVYFAGSIRGGRDLQPLYDNLISLMQFHGHIVLSEHVGDEAIGEEGEPQLDFGKGIFERDISWLEEADVVIAEVSVPSLGVGFEICYAQKVLAKPTLCLANHDNVSAMILGNNDLAYLRYRSEGEAHRKVLKFLRFHERKGQTK